MTSIKVITAGLACLFALQPVRAEGGGTVATNTAFLSSVINREVRGLVERGARKAVRSGGTGTVRVKSLRPHPADWMLEEIITDALAADGIRVLLPVKPVPAVSGPAAAPQQAAVAGSTSVTDSASAAGSAIPVPADSGRTAAAVPGSAAVPSKAPVKTGASEPVAIPERQTEPLVLEYRLVDCSVVYEKIWREGFIGDKKIRRTARAAGSLRLIDARTGALLWQRKFSHAQTEDVLHRHKNQIENSQYNFRKADTPRPYWRSVTETVLAGGSVGYLLYLFFSKSFN